MEKKLYSAPLLRMLEARPEINFLTSGSGEDAHPEDGLWNDDEQF